MSDEPHTVTVTVPSDDYRMDPKTAYLWDLLGHLISVSRKELGDDMTFTVFLSRISRELRRVVGPDGAAEALHKMADTQHDAARADR